MSQCMQQNSATRPGASICPTRVEKPVGHCADRWAQICKVLIKLIFSWLNKCDLPEIGCKGSRGLSINKALIHTWSVAGFASTQFLRGQRVCHVRRSVSNKNVAKVSGVCILSWDRSVCVFLLTSVDWDVQWWLAEDFTGQGCDRNGSCHANFR